MLAAVDYGTPELAGYLSPSLDVKNPGDVSPSPDSRPEDVPDGLAAISKVPGAGWLQIIAYCLFCEASGGLATQEDLEPGNFGWKPPLLTSADPENRKKRLNAEIANGRLTMMAIIGMLFQDGLTGSAWGDWATYTDSPLRALESEPGGQPPPALGLHGAG